MANQQTVINRLGNFIVEECRELFCRAAAQSYAGCSNSTEFFRELVGIMLSPAKTQEALAARKEKLMRLLPREEESRAVAQGCRILLNLCENVLGRTEMDGSPDLLAAERRMRTFVEAAVFCSDGSLIRTDPTALDGPRHWQTGEKLE